MAIPVAKFEVVESSEAPKTTKVLSAEEVAARKAWADGLKALPEGKSMKVDLKSIGGDNPARSFGIMLGHVMKDFSMENQFTTSNDGTSYFITRKTKKAESNGNKTPAAATA